MQRRGPSGQLAKGRRKAKAKARKAPTARASTTDLQERVAALTRELKEAREQQTATSEVLKVISSSPDELEPVFQTMLENATKLCEASYGTMYLREGDGFRAAARQGHSPALAKKNGGWENISSHRRIFLWSDALELEFRFMFPTCAKSELISTVTR
jgi:hypothetical protein